MSSSLLLLAASLCSTRLALPHMLCPFVLITLLHLSGYIGSLSILQTVVRVAQKLREHNPDLVYGAPGLVGLAQGNSGCCRSLPAARHAA